jgi:hypothetical protein
MQLRESTQRAITTYRHHEQKPARLDIDASLTQQGRITAVWSRALTPA